MKTDTMQADVIIIPETETVFPITERTQKKHFAQGLNFYKLFWLFMLGSFFGVVIETLYCLITRHVYESRVGLIYGPFNPVYGGGMVVLTLLLDRIKQKRDLFVMACSMIIGGAFEYLCSLFQEIFFGTVSWEYSHTQFNFAGRTNLMYCMFWGVLGTVFIKDVMPHLHRLIEKIPYVFGVILTWILIVFISSDIFLSVAAVKRVEERKQQIIPSNSFEEFVDRHYDDAFMKEKYPNMMTVRQAQD